jgi:hypothetical protein
MQNRDIFYHEAQRKIYSFSILLSVLLCLLFLSACDSSDTRSTAKSSTSSDSEIQVRITSPLNGATIALTDANPSSQVSFYTAKPLGGTAPFSVTFLSKGPTTSNSATAIESSTTQQPPPAGEDEPASLGLLQFKADLEFLETGSHTITAVARDSRGYTGSNSISVTVVETTPRLQVQITSPVDGATVGFTVKGEETTATADVKFTYATSGGKAPVTVTWLIDGPDGYSNSASSTSVDNTVLTFGPEGQYTISAVARDADGVQVSDSITISIW